MPEKSPYKLVVKFEGARPERIAEALAKLREIAAIYDQTGESTATMTIESWQEAPLRETMDAFEVWLYKHAPGLVPDRGMVLYRPGLRPETAEMLAREKKKTPMDQAGWGGEGESAEEEEEVLITPAPREPLQLPAAGETGETVDGEYTVEDTPQTTGLEEGFKRIYADDLALGLGFEWDYENADDHDLYEALEAMGYEWNGSGWAPIAVETELVEE